MVRILILAPERYNIEKLKGEIQAAFPHCICVNEVEEERRYIATYFLNEEDVPETGALEAIVAAHDPSPVPQPPALEDRISALEDALLLLLMEV